MSRLVKSLRDAAERPDSWDLPGLLNDAADQIEFLAEKVRQQQGEDSGGVREDGKPISLPPA